MKITDKHYSVLRSLQDRIQGPIWKPEYQLWTSPSVLRSLVKEGLIKKNPIRPSSSGYQLYKITNGGVKLYNDMYKPMYVIGLLQQLKTNLKLGGIR